MSRGETLATWIAVFLFMLVFANFAFYQAGL